MAVRKGKIFPPEFDNNCHIFKRIWQAPEKTLTKGVALLSQKVLDMECAEF